MPIFLPPDPDEFDPASETLPAGTGPFRVHSNRFRPTEFNPGVGTGGRFSFFGDPPTPVLYAAETTDAARSETLLHDVPLRGGILHPGMYLHQLESRITITRDLALVSFLGLGLRRLGVPAEGLTATSASHYPFTRQWAQAAHHTGADGIVWMSKRCNSDRAYMLFGDRVVDGTDVVQDPGYGLIFASTPGLNDLIDFCNSVKVRLMLPPASGT